MKLTNQSAVVARVSDQFAYDGWVTWKRVISISRVMDPRGIHSGHKTGSARSAYRTLTIGMSERDTVFDQAVDRATAKSAAPHRDRAEGAGIVAAFGNF